MDNFYFQNPTKILFGKGMVQHIGKELSRINIKKPLILYGQNSARKSGILEIIRKKLDEEGISLIDYGNVQPNPCIEFAKKAVNFARDMQVDAVIAVGGGSVIDTSKLVAAGYYYSGNLWNLFEDDVNINQALPIFSVVTLSASGSEMNSTAVITNLDEQKKWSFSAGVYTTPKLSIIDPELQYSLSQKQTANAIIDTISHVIEYYFNGVKNVDIQDEISEGIIRTVMKHAKIVLQNPMDYESRAQIAWCSTLALNGINSAGRFGGDFASHSIEHSLSAIYPSIAHAEGLSVVLPNWMKYIIAYDFDKFKKFSINIFNHDENDGVFLALKGIHKLRDFFNEMNAPSYLRELGVSKSSLPQIAVNATSRGPLGRLHLLNTSDVLSILEMSY